MTVWNKPFIYVLIHVTLGYFSFRYPILLIGIITYQFLQLFFNVRLFLFSWTIEKGNSIQHTLVKLFETFIGYSIGWLTRTIHQA
jgi:hypothetical protein